MTGTDLADTLLLHLRALRLPLPVREYRALPDRRFRCDLAWPDLKPPLCVEVDGGELMQGRHNRAAGMASDCEKQNLLVLAGWHCLRFTGQQVKDGSALAVVTEALRRFPGGDWCVSPSCSSRNSRALTVSSWASICCWARARYVFR